MKTRKYRNLFRIQTKKLPDEVDKKATAGEPTRSYAKMNETTIILGI